jgi:Contact-dependent growth inhibition CdiA C-terminal domain
LKRGDSGGEMSDKQTYIRESIDLYANADAAYERLYFDRQSGGFVQVHNGHNCDDAFLSELFVAEVFAQSGNRVKLLDESNALPGKHPDADINGEIWDFKEIANAENIAGATQQQIRRGKKQADKVALYVNQEFDIADVNLGIASAIRIDIANLIQKIALIDRTGRLQILNREEFVNGKRFQ